MFGSILPFASLSLFPYTILTVLTYDIAMIEHGNGETPADDDPGIADRAFEARVIHAGESLPRWGRYVTIFEETVGLTPDRRLNAGTKIIDIFNAGAECMNRRFGKYLYRSVMREVHDPAAHALLRVAEEQRMLRRMEQALAHLDEHRRPEGDSTRRPHR